MYSYKKLARRLSAIGGVVVAGTILSCSALAADLPTDLKFWQLPEWNSTVATVEGSTPGTKALLIKTKTPDWSQQILLTAIYPQPITRVEFKGAMRTEGVKAGVQTYEKARAQLSFLDENGKRLGAWPGTTDHDGTTDWTPFSQSHHCPAGTRAVSVMLGMYQSTGTAAFENLSLVAYGETEQVIEPLPLKAAEATNTTGWWTFAPGTEDESRPLILDMTHWMDAPAGKHGFMKTDGENFRFADGTVARFWGAGAWIGFDTSKVKLAECAARLARLGINIVRLHGMDSMDPQKSILDRDGKLNPNRLDTLDFCIAEFKKQGIYVDLNLLTKRRYYPEDGVPSPDGLPEGGKGAAIFNRRMIDLQKDYARQIFTHKNPYTGVTYAEEPAIAVTEIINEAYLFDVGMWATLPDAYHNELKEKFAAWCQVKGVSTPEGKISALILAKDANFLSFLAQVERDYYAEMSSLLKNDLKIKIPVSGNNWGETAADLQIVAALDFIDRHAYWDHPSGGWAPTSQFKNEPLVSVLDHACTSITDTVRQRVAGRPFTVSEWEFVWSDEYITEGPLLMAALGGVQNWSALMQFSIAGRPWSAQMHGCFENDSKPHLVAPSVAASLMYLRGDIAPGVPERLPLDATAPTAPAGKDFTPADCWSREIALTVDGVPATNSPDAISRPADALHWQPPGMLTVDTPRSQAVVGLTAGADIKLADMTINLKNRFGQVIVNSLDDREIRHSGHLLITATARAENTGEEYHPFRKGLRNVGTAPILLEPVVATLALARDSGAPVVYALDWYGRRTDQHLPVTKNPVGAWTVSLGKVPAYWFEVVYPDEFNSARLRNN